MTSPLPDEVTLSGGPLDGKRVKRPVGMLMTVPVMPPPDPRAWLESHCVPDSVMEDHYYRPNEPGSVWTYIGGERRTDRWTPDGMVTVKTERIAP